MFGKKKKDAKKTMKGKSNVEAGQDNAKGCSGSTKSSEKSCACSSKSSGK